jgi:hypothetical protein
MAKKQAAFSIVGQVGTVSVTYKNDAVFAQGNLLELSEDSVTLSVKRPRSSKRDLLTVGLDRITYASLAASEGDAYIAYRGEDSVAFDGVTVTQIVNGSLLGTVGDDETPFIAAAGTWTFSAEFEAEAAAEEKPTKADKAAPKGKAKPEPEEEPENEEEGEEFEVGDYVTVTDADEEEVTGTIKTLTAKKLVVTDDEGESHTFKPDDVTVAHAEKPKAKKPAGKKPAAKEEAEDEAKPAKGGKANKKPAPAEDDGDWGDEE